MLLPLQRIAGIEKVVNISAIAVAEDFSFYQQEILGMYFFLEGKSLDIKTEDASRHHTRDFVINESRFGLGIKSMTALTLD
jgi:metal-dependent amidase/aminoacylase/carboxypeptidase family protein